MIDTSVLSEFAPGRRTMSSERLEWFRAHERLLHVSVVSVAETVQRIAKLRRDGAVVRAQTFEDWLNGAVRAFGRKVLPLDEPTARIVGMMSEAAYATGRHPGFADIATAATASRHEMTVLTRNLKHFVPLGIDVLDPFAPADPLP